MNYLEKKKQIFMTILDAFKIGLITDQPSVTLPNTIGKPIIDYKIYGNSTQTKKNLIIYPYINNSGGTEFTTHVNNGVTFTNVGDGTIKVSGTATAASQLWLRVPIESIERNCLYRFSGCPTNGSGTTYNLTLQFYKNNAFYQGFRDDGTGANIQTVGEYDKILMKFYVAKGITVDNLIFKPQLERNNATTEYESPAMSMENPLEIISLGESTKNLIIYPYTETTKVSNGVTWTDNKDGWINANGTPTNYSFFYIRDVVIESNKTYLVSMNMKNPNECSNVCTQVIIENNAGAQTTKTLTINSPYIIITAPDNGGKLKMQFKRLNNVDSCAGNYLPTVIEANNLLNVPFTDGTKTENGITFTPNKNGTITLDGILEDNSATFTFSNNIMSENFNKNSSYIFNLDNADVTGEITLWKDSIVINNYEFIQTGIFNFSEYDFDQISIHFSIKNRDIAFENTVIKPVFCEINEAEPLNYKLPIIVHGKNVFDVSKCASYDETKNGLYLSTSNSRIVNQGRFGDIANIVANKTYIFSAETTYTTALYCYLRNTKKTLAWNTPIMLTKEDIDDTLCFIRGSQATTITNIQLEEGLTATNYEPYQQPIEKNIYFITPLRKGDIIDFENSKVLKYADEVTFTGTENWKMTTAGTAKNMIYLGKANVAQQTNYGFCTHFPFMVGNNPDRVGYIDWWYVNNVIRITQKQTNNVNTYFVNADAFKTYLQEQYANGTPVKAIVPRKTPTEEILSGLPELSTYEGTTVITVPTDLIVPKASIKYYRGA